MFSTLHKMSGIEIPNCGLVNYMVIKQLLQGYYKWSVNTSGRGGGYWLGDVSSLNTC